MLALAAFGTTVAMASPDGHVRLPTSCPTAENAPATHVSLAGPSKDFGIWIVGADGSNPTRITTKMKPFSVTPWTIDAAWSSDWSRLAYVNDRRDLVVENPFGGPGEPIVIHQAPENGRPVSETLGQAYLHQVAWSYDGKAIAGVLDGGYEAGDKLDPIAALAVVSLDSSELRSLTTIRPYGSTTAPAWSPDGSQLVLATDDSPKNASSRLEILNADGSGRRVLIDDAVHRADRSGGSAGHASWSPDGRWIAFSAGGGYYDPRIEVVHPDGSGRRVIARGCSADDLAWSPDGTKIVFADEFGIVVMNSDGSNMIRVANAWYGYNPTWSPDGNRIAFLRR